MQKKTLLPMTQTELNLLSLCVEYTASHVCASDEMKALFEKVKFYALKTKNEERVRKNAVPRKKKVNIVAEAQKDLAQAIAINAPTNAMLQKLESIASRPKRTYKKKGGAKWAAKHG